MGSVTRPFSGAFFPAMLGPRQRDCDRGRLVGVIYSIDGRRPHWASVEEASVSAKQRVADLCMVGRDAFDLALRTEKHRNALVQLVRLYFENAHMTVRGKATRLFHNVAHRIGLIHQT